MSHPGTQATRDWARKTQVREADGGSTTSAQGPQGWGQVHGWAGVPVSPDPSGEGSEWCP